MTLTSRGTHAVVLVPLALPQVHVQNATLAGGVAVGTVADLMILPAGAAGVGICAGLLSSIGFNFVMVSGGPEVLIAQSRDRLARFTVRIVELVAELHEHCRTVV